MAYDVQMATRLTVPVNRRLRMLVLLKGQPLSHVLTGLLDQHLPSADELLSDLRIASRLGDSDGAAA
jgi:hypothetical protein